MSEKEKQAAQSAEQTEQTAETQAGQPETAAPETQASAQEPAQPAAAQSTDEKGTEDNTIELDAPAAKQKKDSGKKNREAEALQAKLAAAEKKQAEAQEQLLRTAAEYDNFRKRSAREAEQKFNDGVSFAVTQILPILDTLDMAAKAPCTDESFKKGVTMTLDKAAKALETMHIQEIEAEGKPFDPNLMNAVSQVPAPEGVESGAVVTVYQKGYLLGDKVVRHATVVVAE